MKSLTYVGTCTAGVEIATPTFAAFCEHGGSVDVPDDIAASLLEQAANWITTKPKNNNTKEAAE
jgi:hypothetical protein